MKNHKSEIKAKYDVKRIGIFGSYAKGLQNEKSDIDVLVEFENPTFDNFMELSFIWKIYLEKTLIFLLPKLKSLHTPFIGKRGSLV